MPCPRLAFLWHQRHIRDIQVAKVVAMAAIALNSLNQAAAEPAISDAMPALFNGSNQEGIWIARDAKGWIDGRRGHRLPAAGPRPVHRGLLRENRNAAGIETTLD